MYFCLSCVAECVHSKFLQFYVKKGFIQDSFDGDQLVAKPLLTAAGDCNDDGEVGGMNDFGRGN
jgi:hypothetical protein